MFLDVPGASTPRLASLPYRRARVPSTRWTNHDPAPVPLPANRVPVYYAGGDNIDRFRGVARGPGPEDWVGSMSALPAAILPAGLPGATTGVSRLPDGRKPARRGAADPVGWLGPALADALRRRAGLLVKLLDAGERLPVHCHPTARSPARHSTAFGKTEGWIIMAGAGRAGLARHARGRWSVATAALDVRPGRRGDARRR